MSYDSALIKESYLGFIICFYTRLAINIMHSRGAYLSGRNQGSTKFSAACRCRICCLERPTTKENTPVDKATIEGGT